jgi:hypothetical protein
MVCGIVPHGPIPCRANPASRQHRRAAGAERDVEPMSVCVDEEQTAVDENRRRSCEINESCEFECEADHTQHHLTGVFNSTAHKILTLL